MTTPQDDPISALGSGAIPGWGRLLMTMGVFPGLAIWLVWILVSRVTVTLDAMKDKMDAHQSTSGRIEQQLNEEISQRAETNQILRQICVSVAPDAPTRRGCNQ